MSQELALEKIKSGENTVILGQAGTGKSFVINKITDNTTVKCAPAGIAALNIEGMTCHKMFNLPVGKPQEQDYFIVGNTMRNLFKGSSPVDTVVIDEVGQLRADYLDMIDSKLRTLRRNNKPFGGIQVVGSGDFYQLEPIVPDNERRGFRKRYKSPYCFDAESWDFDVVELTKVYRQSDERQVRLLQSIREKDKWYKRALDVIQEEAKPYDPVETTMHLCCYKTDAHRINRMWYKRVDEKEHVYNCQNDAGWKEAECAVPFKVKLKVGCRVLVKANNTDGGYVNGDKGWVVDCTPLSVFVKLDRNGQTVEVIPNKWDKHKYGTSGDKVTKEVESSYTQIPLLLGYAVTTHSVQGMTLDDVAIDFGQGCFAAGQAYVALSRIRDLKNMSFVNDIYPSDIIVRDEVVEFYENLRGRF